MWQAKRFGNVERKKFRRVCHLSCWLLPEYFEVKVSLFLGSDEPIQSYIQKTATFLTDLLYLIFPKIK